MKKAKTAEWARNARGEFWVRFTFAGEPGLGVKGPFATQHDATTKCDALLAGRLTDEEIKEEIRSILIDRLTGEGPKQWLEMIDTGIEDELEAKQVIAKATQELATWIRRGGERI